MVTANHDITHFLDSEIYPRLFDRLDQVFPDFGWQRTNDGCAATNYDYTKSQYGARADRVVCHRPFGFLIYGGSAVSWLAYTNGGTRPTGRAFIEAVRKLAMLAGADTAILDQPYEPARQEQAQRREGLGTLLETFFAQSQDMLASEAGEPGRRYLKEKRGFEPDSIAQLPLGYFTTMQDAKDRLLKAGFTEDEVQASGLLSDRRWEGRIVGVVRDEWGHSTSFWARDIAGKADDGSKYLYLKGGKKPVAFGLDVALRNGGRDHLVLVEGVLDVVNLQSRGFRNVTALGGDGRQLTAKRLERLGDLGVSRITLVLDNNQAGREGSRHAAEQAFRTPNAPTLFVVAPEYLGEAKDPDELVREEGVEALTSIVETSAIPRHCYPSQQILQNHCGELGWTESGRQAALDEALAIDDAVSAPEELPYMESLFWPRILEELNVSWDSVLARRKPVRERQAIELVRHRLSSAIGEATSALGSRDLAKAARILQTETSYIQSEQRKLLSRPPKPVIEKLDEHEEYLTKFRRQEYIGLPQGMLARLDDATLGLRGLMLLAAAPNVGKTALAVQFGTDIVRLTPDACVVFVSLEMREDEIITRLKCRLAEVNWKTLVLGSRFIDGEWTRTPEELAKIALVERQLKEIGPRILILDERNCPSPTIETILDYTRDLKAKTGCKRAFILIDYLQVFPIPTSEEASIRTELDADKWRIGAMKTLRDAADEDAIMVISESRKPSGNSGESWGGAMANVMGSARASYTPDIIFLFRQWNDEEIEAAFLTEVKLRGNELKYALEQTRKNFRDDGYSLNKLIIAKGRDGVRKEAMDIVFNFYESRLEDWPFQTNR